MPYGTANVDTIQSSTAGTPVQFNDGNGTQVGTLCRAWVNFGYVASAITVRASFNVSSVTRSSAGIYTINLTNALADTSGSVVSMNEGDSTQANRGCCGYLSSTSAVLLGTFTTNTGAQTDMTKISVAVFR